MQTSVVAFSSSIGKLQAELESEQQNKKIVSKDSLSKGGCLHRCRVKIRDCVGMAPETNTPLQTHAETLSGIQCTILIDHLQGTSEVEQIQSINVRERKELF